MAHIQGSCFWVGGQVFGNPAWKDPPRPHPESGPQIGLPSPAARAGGSGLGECSRRPPPALRPTVPPTPSLCVLCWEQIYLDRMRCSVQILHPLCPSGLGRQGLQAATPGPWSSGPRWLEEVQPTVDTSLPARTTGLYPWPPSLSQIQSIAPLPLSCPPLPLSLLAPGRLSASCSQPANMDSFLP